MCPRQDVSSGRSGPTATERVVEALRVIEESEPWLNAYITVTGRLAVDRARSLDEGFPDRGAHGPLWGAPYAAKDVFLTRGIRTTGGSAALRDYVPSEDAEVIRRLDAQGAILVGKTNMNELGWGTTEAFGRTNNPRAPDRSAGGSSGGSAATVGAGAVRLAVGTDAGGSIRVPAAFCGVVGFKPTVDRVPCQGTLLGVSSLTCAAPLGGSVEDVCIGFEAMAPDARLIPRRRTPRKIAVLWADCIRMDDSVEQAVEDALERLRARGTLLSDIEIRELDECLGPWLVTYSVEMAESVRSLIPDLHRLTPDMQELIKIGRKVSGRTYLRAQRFRSRWFQRIEELLLDVEAIASPTVPYVAWADEPGEDDEAYYGSMRWTMPFNLSGHPAISLPVPTGSLPVGLQLIGPFYRDEELLQIASWCEDALIA